MIRAIASLFLFFVAANGVAQTNDGPAAAIEPLRLSTTIERQRAVIEIRDLSRPAAEEAIRSAFMVISDTLRSLDIDSPGSDLWRLNAAAGQGPQQIDADLLYVLQKTMGFCLWSRGANGPIGGRLYELWESSSLPPAGGPLHEAAQAANCETLQLLPDTLQASLASDCRLDLRHFAAGIAVDRAVTRLQEHGGSNLWVELGSVMRAHGAGADGHGWRFALPQFAGMSENLEPVRLKDLSMAVVSAHRDRLRFGELSYAPFLDQRTGEPASGVVAVLVTASLAADAQAIATTMVIVGNREGALRLGGVTPAPSVLWVLGDGSGEPLLNTFKWSALGSF